MPRTPISFYEFATRGLSLIPYSHCLFLLIGKPMCVCVCVRERA